jgi:formate hydrogenlyase subunit 6/NADH:ubiquinone oxidoreductase subunit I
MKHPGRIIPEIFRMLVKKPATVNYPQEKKVMPKNFRGKIKFDSKACIGCKICMRDCPAKAIEISPTGQEKVFKSKFYLDRCIFCAQCVDSCPRKALSSSTEFELAHFDRKKLEEDQE